MRICADRRVREAQNFFACPGFHEVIGPGHDGKCGTDTSTSAPRVPSCYLAPEVDDQALCDGLAAREQRAARVRGGQDAIDDAPIAVHLSGSELRSQLRACFQVSSSGFGFRFDSFIMILELRSRLGQVRFRINIRAPGRRQSLARRSGAAAAGAAPPRCSPCGRA